MLRYDAPVVVDSDQARQLAVRELGKARYHQNGGSSQGGQGQFPGSTPSTAIPSPPPQNSSSGSAVTVILVILAVIVLAVAIILVVRRFGRPRAEKKKQKAKKPAGEKAAAIPRESLTGAALHRSSAQSAADAGDWAEAIRERFRAVIGTLDERGLLPERPDRTADEAAHDAGVLLPAHGLVLAAAARAFDDVEYGEYVGTEEGYRVISEVDELVLTAQPGALAQTAAAARANGAS